MVCICSPLMLLIRATRVLLAVTVLVAVITLAAGFAIVVRRQRTARSARRDSEAVRVLEVYVGADAPSIGEILAALQNRGMAVNAAMTSAGDDGVTVVRVELKTPMDTATAWDVSAALIAIIPAIDRVEYPC